LLNAIFISLELVKEYDFYTFGFIRFMFINFYPHNCIMVYWWISTSGSTKKNDVQVFFYYWCNPIYLTFFFHSLDGCWLPLTLHYHGLNNFRSFYRNIGQVHLFWRLLNFFSIYLTIFCYSMFRWWRPLTLHCYELNSDRSYYWNKRHVYLFLNQFKNNKFFFHPQYRNNGTTLHLWSEKIWYYCLRILYDLFIYPPT